jgi:hypothetical protein
MSKGLLLEQQEEWDPLWTVLAKVLAELSREWERV